MRILLLVLLATAVLAPTRALADDRQDALGGLAAARDRFALADWPAVITITEPLVTSPALDAADRAEAWRLRGLALFFLGRTREAEAALLQYLELEPDAHLDPALISPDAVLFFEEVRSRHAGQIAMRKPRPQKRRYAALNFLPPMGQLQNGERTKAWAIGGTGVALLGANVATYALLASQCDSGDRTCQYDYDTAVWLRRANLTTAVLLGALYLYGVIDGFQGSPAEITYTPGPPGRVTHTSVPMPATSLGFSWRF